mmetsp:Transcript_9432/g.21389  ORF Transcript_9432/g.21389 Transcript_9432/m.21389 type:complete len:245 (+) Transcript_9432:1518-2252(+)
MSHCSMTSQKSPVLMEKPKSRSRGVSRTPLSCIAATSSNSRWTPPLHRFTATRDGPPTRLAPGQAADTTRPKLPCPRLAWLSSSYFLGSRSGAARSWSSQAAERVPGTSETQRVKSSGRRGRAAGPLRWLCSTASTSELFPGPRGSMAVLSSLRPSGVRVRLSRASSASSWHSGSAASQAMEGELASDDEPVRWDPSVPLSPKPARLEKPWSPPCPSLTAAALTRSRSRPRAKRPSGSSGFLLE